MERFPKNVLLQQFNVRLAKETTALPPVLVRQAANPAFVVSLNQYKISETVRLGQNPERMHPGLSSEGSECP